jgi:uncharacterized protein YrrD
MQRRGTALIGSTVDATDGHVGRIEDLLFDDKTWALRWFVISTGAWRLGRQILVHPAALEKPDSFGRPFSAKQTRKQVEASLGILSDQPVSRQMEQSLGDGYSYTPTLGGGYYDIEAFGLPTEGWLSNYVATAQAGTPDADPHLRSLNEVKGYHVHALDGEIGHLSDFLIDDESWKIEYALIDTRNWWAGKHVLLPAAAITEMDWAGRYLRVDQTCYNIKSSLPWTEPDWTGQIEP